MATYYIDPTAPVNGSGTFASPYNTQPTIADNCSYWFKEGTVWSGRVGTYAPSRPGLAWGVYDAVTGERVTDGSKWFTWDFRNRLVSSSHAMSFGLLCAPGLDIQGMIIMAGWFVNNNGITYQCILGHTSAALTEPGVGASWATYWIAHSVCMTDAPQWSTGTAYEVNNGACLDVRVPSLVNCTLRHIRTVGCALGLNMTEAGIVAPNIFDLSSSKCFGSVSVAIGGTSGSSMSNPNFDGIEATDCKGLGISYKRITGTSTSIRNSKASFNRGGGISFTFVYGLSESSVDGIESTDNIGNNLIIDSGCNTLILNNVIGDRASDNGFSAIDLFSPGNAPVNCEVRRFRFLNCGNADLYTANPASDGDGFSCHAGTGWVFDTGISCANLNSGCCHVGGSTGTIRNAILVGNGYNPDGTRAPEKYKRGGLSLLSSGNWHTDNCIIRGNAPFDIQLSAPTLLTADTNGLNSSGAFTSSLANNLDLAAFITAVTSGGGMCTNAVTGDPLLGAASDYRPSRPDSPAIGAGKGCGIGLAGIDFDGNQRPAPGGDYTLGPYEDYPPPKDEFGPWVHFDPTSFTPPVALDTSSVVANVQRVAVFTVTPSASVIKNLVELGGR